MLYPSLFRLAKVDLSTFRILENLPGVNIPSTPSLPPFPSITTHRFDPPSPPISRVSVDDSPLGVFFSTQTVRAPVFFFYALRPPLFPCRDGILVKTPTPLADAFFSCPLGFRSGTFFFFSECGLPPPLLDRLRCAVSPSGKEKFFLESFSFLARFSP